MSKNMTPVKFITNYYLCELLEKKKKNVNTAAY